MKIKLKTRVFDSEININKTALKAEIIFLALVLIMMVLFATTEEFYTLCKIIIFVDIVFCLLVIFTPFDLKVVDETQSAEHKNPAPVEPTKQPMEKEPTTKPKSVVVEKMPSGPPMYKVPTPEVAGPSNNNIDFDDSSIPVDPIKDLHRSDYVLDEDDSEEYRRRRREEYLRIRREKAEHSEQRKVKPIEITQDQEKNLQQVQSLNFSELDEFNDSEL